jgi:hypothetical protein
VSVGANIQPATTKVTNRNAVSFRVLTMAEAVNLANF